MSQQTINLGTLPAATDGDTARAAFTKVNSNLTELYAGQADLASKTVYYVADGDSRTAIHFADPSQYYLFEPSWFEVLRSRPETAGLYFRITEFLAKLPRKYLTLITQ